MKTPSSLRLLSFLGVVALAACGADEPGYREPPKLPPCPRVIGSVYTPGAVTTTAPSSTTPATAAPVAVTPAATADIPQPTFKRTPFTPPKRPPVSTEVAKCGGVKDPCPLQRWMREQMAPALAAKNAPALAKALDASANMSPVASWEWKGMAIDAAAAARAGDVETARKSCQTCHNAFKTQYQSKFRLRPVK